MKRVEKQAESNQIIMYFILAKEDNITLQQQQQHHTYYRQTTKNFVSSLKLTIHRLRERKYLKKIYLHYILMSISI